MTADLAGTRVRPAQRNGRKGPAGGAEACA